MFAEEKLLGCWKASTWAKLVAIFQLLSSVLSILIAVLSLAGVATHVRNKSNHVHREWIPESDIKASVLLVLIVSLVTAILGAIFGIILLVGLAKKSRAYLKSWIIFTGLFLVWTVLGTALGLGRSTGGLWVRVGQCIIELLVYSFGIWIVYQIKVGIVPETQKTIEK